MRWCFRLCVECDQACTVCYAHTSRQPQFWGWLCGSAASPEGKLSHHAASSIAGSGMVEHAIPSPWDTNLLDFQCANDLVATLNTHIASAQQLLCYCPSPLWAAVYIGRHQVAVPSLCRLHITIHQKKKKKGMPEAPSTYALSNCTLSMEGKMPQDTFATRVGFNCAFV